MARGKRVSKQALRRGSGRNVRMEVTPDYDSEKPSWRFSTVDRGGPFAWPIGSKDELKIVEKLHAFDSMRWSEILSKQHHRISIESLSKDAQLRLQEIKLDDIDFVYSFRLQGKPRIFCIRDGSVAKLLWFDPEHQVCPSTKKRT